MSFKATEEQLAAVELSKITRVLKLEAGAGCTKTTTLSLVAKANPVPSLYMAFNKALADEAKDKFPNWVTCKTTHSVAYAAFGAQLQNKLKRPDGPYQNVCGTGSEIARYYKIRGESFCGDKDKMVTAAGIGVAIKETLARFESSADELLHRKHVSYNPVKHYLEDLTFNRENWATTVISYAAMLWKERIDTRSRIMATHDTYLKLYQLSKPDLGQYVKLYLDEMQDSTDCVIDIIKRQKSCQIVLVGDDAQAIYGWRGAVSAMDKFECETAQLTKSFRFGPAIASEARMVLSLKERGGLDLQGWEGAKSEVLDYLPEEREGEVRCILYRTNSALIADGVEYILAGKKVALEMDTKDYMAVMRSVIALKFNDMKNVKHEEVVPYPSWRHLMEELEHLSGGDLPRIAKLVAENQHERVVQALEDYQKPRNPDLILTTAHKSKGREFEIVVLASDFPGVFDKDGEWVGLEDAEANLLYVALTRAKSLLVRNSTLKDIRKKLYGNKPPSLVVGAVSVTKGEDAVRVLATGTVSNIMDLGPAIDFDEANDALAMARADYMQDDDDYMCPQELDRYYVEGLVGTPESHWRD